MKYKKICILQKKRYTVYIQRERVTERCLVPKATFSELTALRSSFSLEFFSFAKNKTINILNLYFYFSIQKKHEEKVIMITAYVSNNMKHEYSKC